MRVPAAKPLSSWLKAHEIQGNAGTLILTYIQPGASKTAIKGIYQERLKLSVQAPPVEGAANEAVLKFIASALGVAKSKVHLISGETSRMKNVWVMGIGPDETAEKLEP
jgi:uncharacterized protein (TIGR00251 family)